MASGNGGNAFMGFLLGAVVAVVALMGVVVYSNLEGEGQLVSLDLTRPSVPSNPR